MARGEVGRRAADDEHVRPPRGLLVLAYPREQRPSAVRLGIILGRDSCDKTGGAIRQRVREYVRLRYTQATCQLVRHLIEPVGLEQHSGSVRV